MKKIVHLGNSRGHADHGWLNSFHTFSFAGYHNPSRNNFGVLRVLNDDIVAAGRGFGAHPHQNMEIISIPLSGALKHSDDTGRTEIINAGDVQIMSAGCGIAHSEMNASTTEPVNFLQIWIFPKVDDIKPRYEQKTFAIAERKNNFQVVVSPVKDADSIWINQNAWLTLSDIDAEKDLRYELHLKTNGVYIFVLEGAIEVDRERLSTRDAIAISETMNLDIKALLNSKLLIIEIPML